MERPDLDALIEDANDYVDPEIYQWSNDWDKGQVVPILEKLLAALKAERIRADKAAAQALEDMAHEIAAQRDSATLDIYGDSQWAVRDHSDGRYLGKTVAIRMIREKAKQLRAKDTE